MPDVVVVRTGSANIASVLAALRRCDVQLQVSEDPEQVLEAQAVVLPGVGSFGAVMDRLHALDLVKALRLRIAQAKPMLCICVGMQILARTSEESPNTDGLAVLDGTVQRFPSGVRVPHLGWNRVETDQHCRFLQPGYAYFAHSYRLRDAPPGWAAARTDYPDPFVAALERGRTLACQFHPELSGQWGAELLRRWLCEALAQEEATC